MSKDFLIEDNNDLDTYLVEIAQYRQLSAQEERELAWRIIGREDTEAKEKLIKHNLKLVVAEAKKHRGLLEFWDLIQEGNLGLIKAASTYDPERGTRFSTHAVWWIVQSIRRAIEDKARTIRIPAYLETELRRIKRMRNSYLNQFGHEPEIAEIAEALEIPEERIKNLLQVESTSSLDRDLHNDFSDPMTFADVIEDENNEIDRMAEIITAQQIVDQALKRMEPRERYIVARRYGVGDQNENTRSLEEIGKELKLTRERVRQIEASGFKRIKIHELREAWCIGDTQPMTREEKTRLKRSLVGMSKRK